MERGGTRAITRRALTAATVALLALGGWLAAGAVQPRHDKAPEPVWTPVRKAPSGGLHA